MDLSCTRNQQRDQGSDILLTCGDHVMNDAHYIVKIINTQNILEMSWLLYKLSFHTTTY